MIGREISHYKVVEKIGEGGMGVVFRAEDLKLHRPVVLKFLSPRLTADADAVARFEREAQAAAALKHPNIVVIYDIGEFEDQVYLCLEYVEGEELANVLSRGPMPVEKALDVAIKIGEGLGAAHHAGIVHRDIKPENILAGADGEVKILDFGLAKLHGVSRLTKEASTVGTVAYMSPEMTKGEDVDQRTDIWSLGILLYEMIAGRRPFDGDYEQAVAYAIVNQEAEPLRAVTGGVPEGVERVVEKAMAKDPEDRYQTVDEMTAELRALQETTEGDETRLVKRSKRRGRIAPAAIGSAAAAVVLLVALFWWLGTRDGEGRGPDTDTTKQQAKQLELIQATFSSEMEEYPAFAPDGRRIAFCREIDGYRQVVVKDLFSTREERVITDTRADNIQPTWSPDGQSILFVRSSRPDGKMEPGDVFGVYSEGDVWRYDLAGDKEQKLIDAAFDPAVSPDGSRIAVDASWAGTRRIWVVDEFGRNAQQVTLDNSEAVSHLDPQWSPGGDKIVFVNMERTRFDIKTVDLDTREQEWLTNDLHKDVNPVWSPTGTVYFSSTRGGGMNVWRVPLKPGGNPMTPPQQVTTGAGQDVHLAVSADGTKLAISILGINADLYRLPLSLETGLPTGEPEAVVTTTREDSRGAWSPDGLRIAFNSDRAGDMNIWVYSFSDGASKQVTSGSGGDFQANWSPEGTRLVFFSSRAGNADIWLTDLGTGELTQLTHNLSLDINPFFSPDGERIAFQSDLDGRMELWVVNADGTNRRRLTNIGISGHFMRWTPDGAHIVFRSPHGVSGQLYRVPVAGGDPQPYAVIKGGAHISFSPTHNAIMDVSGHKTIWLTKIPDGESQLAFEFENPDLRIDYPVWSPDGRWLLFDRVEMGGGDIWLIENFE